MVASITKAGMEKEIARVISRFHEDQHGCRPSTAVAYLVGDMAIVRCTGCFTPTESSLSSSEDGRKLVKSARRELRSLNRRDVERQVGEIVGSRVIRSFWDLDIRVGEQVEVYVFDPVLAFLS
jgi:uncharacterized protein YbcI